MDDGGAAIRSGTLLRGYNYGEYGVAYEFGCGVPSVCDMCDFWWIYWVVDNNEVSV